MNKAKKKIVPLLRDNQIETKSLVSNPKGQVSL